MRVISNKKLVEAAESYPDIEDRLQAWRKMLERNAPRNFSGLRALFNSVDKVNDLYVFNIRGNNYRLVCGIDFTRQLCFVRHILTHTDYDRGKWK